MKELVLVIHSKDKEALASVRSIPELKVAVEKDRIWLRGIHPEKQDIRLRQLPSMKTFELDEAGNLFPHGRLTPEGKLEELDWLPLAEFIQVELPTSALPGKTEGTFPVRLTASQELHESAALLTTLSLWQSYAEGAPEIRLRQLRFAVSDKGEVLLVGTPLPPLPGQEYWISHTLLLPCGYDFELPVLAPLLASKLNPSNEVVCIFSDNNEFELIPQNAFVQATRSGIRLSGKATL